MSLQLCSFVLPNHGAHNTSEKVKATNSRECVCESTGECGKFSSGDVIFMAPFSTDFIDSVSAKIFYCEKTSEI
jgi:hypothetical protein